MKTFTLRLIPLLFVLMVPGWVGGSDRTITVQERRTALVIGNSDYSSSPLKNPVNDAEDLAKLLNAHGFEVLLRRNVTEKQMKHAVLEFGEKLKRGGVGLFYYAGHGMQVKGRNYLIPVGSSVASESDVEFEAMDAARVLGKMEEAENSINLVILDACRNNPFSRSFRSGSAGLARMEAPTGSLIAYATAPGSVAADGEGRNGVYTRHLLTNLQVPGLTIEKVLKNVRVAVLKETDRLQTPWESSSLTGEFVFNLKKSGESAWSNSVLAKEQKEIKRVRKHHGLALEPSNIGLSGHYLAIGAGGGSYKYLYNVTGGFFDNDKLPYYSFVSKKKYWKSFSIKTVGKKGEKSGVELRMLGEIDRTISIESEQFGTISEHTFTNLGNILLGTTKGYVLLYNRSGELLEKFREDEGAVVDLAVHRDTIATVYSGGVINILTNVEKEGGERLIITLAK